MKHLDYLHLTDLSDDEKKALELYKTASDNAERESGCFVLNRKLEYGLFPDELGLLGDTARALDAVFSRCPKLKEPQTVYRAIGLRSHYPVSVPGSRFRNLSFWSTSTDYQTARDFLDADGVPGLGALLHLHLPPGLPVYNVELIEGVGGHEQELLLPRGILWTVGDGSLLDLSVLLPHVAAKFFNVCEVHLEAGSTFRIR